MSKDMEKINSFFASNTGAENVCLTSDNSLFKQENFSFAVAHSQRLEDKKLIVFGKNENFKDSKKNLFYPGSSYEFVLFSEDEKNVELSVYEGLKKTELQDLAENLEGYTTKLTKEQLIELLTSNEEK